MKATLNVEAESQDQLQLLIRVAEEMGMAVQANRLMDEVTLISEKSLAEDWLSTEDARWDEVYAHFKK